MAVAKQLVAALFQVGPNWIRPLLPKPKSDDRQQQQQDLKKGGKVTPGRAVSGAMEDELAGKTCGHVIIADNHGQPWGGWGRRGDEHIKYKWYVKLPRNTSKEVPGDYNTRA